MLSNAQNQLSPLSLTEQEEKILPIQVHLVSQTPGRVRLRFAHPHRHQHIIAPISQALKEQREIYHLKTNVHSGSITLFHGKEKGDFEDIRGILQDLGIILQDIAEETVPRIQGHSQMSAEITQLVTDLNQRVKRVTDGVVDLRFLIPFGFGALALRQLAVKGLQWDLIPWYVLAWYAFDSFIKLNQTPEGVRSEE